MDTNLTKNNKSQRWKFLSIILHIMDKFKLMELQKKISE
jgi:hypothetical protein